MPSSLAKVQKHVRKKKGKKNKSLHENSRDAQRLRRAEGRDDKVARLSSIRQQVNQQWIERIVFIHQRLPATLHPLEISKIKDLVQGYVKRNDEEIVQMKSERRAGRAPSTRQVLFEQQRRTDEKEFESGFWLPNLQDEETLMKLDGWKGDWIGLSNMRFVRVVKEGELRESQFPPRGAS